MTFIIILSVALYLIIGVVLGLICLSIVHEDKMTAWEWFCFIVAWLPAVVVITIEWIVELLRRFIK